MEVSAPPGNPSAGRSRLKGWAQLVGVLALVWVFGTVVGPWLETRIPTFNKIVETIDQQDIDAGAYFYSEIKASYDGEQYLRSALELGGHREANFTPAFASAIVICILLLALGFRYLPND